MLEDVGVGENGAKMWVVQNYSLARTRAKLWKFKHVWVKGSCWRSGIELELATKAWARKKTSFHKFSQLLVKKCLNRIYVSLCLVAPPQRGKVKHHWGKAYSQSRYHFFTTRLKDFVFAIFEIQNLNGINLSERYWIIQIMITFMVVMDFHMHM